MRNCLWNPWVLWVEISPAVLGSSDAGMLSQTLHSLGFRLVVSSGSSAFSQTLKVGVLPSRHTINAFKYLKGHYVEQWLFYPVQLLRLELEYGEFLYEGGFILNIYCKLGFLGSWLWDGDFHVGSLLESAVGINSGESEGSRTGQRKKLNFSAASTRATLNPVGLIRDYPSELPWV